MQLSECNTTLLQVTPVLRVTKGQLGEWAAAEDIGSYVPDSCSAEPDPETPSKYSCHNF